MEYAARCLMVASAAQPVLHAAQQHLETLATGLHLLRVPCTVVHVASFIVTVLSRKSHGQLPKSCLTARVGIV